MESREEEEDEGIFKVKFKTKGEQALVSGSNSGGPQTSVCPQNGGRRGLQGQRWRPVVRPDCRLAGWRPHVTPLMLLLDISRCDAYIAARRQADLCPQSSFISIPLNLAVFARLRHPAKLNWIQVNQLFLLFSPFLVVSLHCCDLFSGNVSGKRKPRLRCGSQGCSKGRERGEHSPLFTFIVCFSVTDYCTVVQC